MQGASGEVGVALEPGEVRLFWMRAEPATLWADHPLLDAGERIAVGRVRSAPGRAQRAAGRVLLRAALSRCADVPPRQWGFEVAPGGRPRLAAPYANLGLSFGIAHTAGIAVCGIAVRGDVGVDVEAEDRPLRALALAGRFFGAGEVAALEALGAPARERRMLATWLCSEAAVKAAGLGIAAGLSRWVADHGAFGPIGLQLLRLPPAHRVAVALRGAGASRMSVRLCGALEGGAHPGTARVEDLVGVPTAVHGREVRRR